MDAALTATAVRFAADKLVALLEGEYKAVSGVEGKVEKLKSTLSIIDDVLRDAESLPVMDRAVRHQLEKLKDAACDVEDVLDTFDTEARRRRSGAQLCMTVRDFFSPNNQVLFLFKISGSIKTVIKRLDSILVEKSLLSKLTQGSVERPSRLEDRRQTHSQNSLGVVGREMEKENIVSMLIDHESDEIISVIAIVGMGGLGKTTLAQLVFSEKRVLKDHFYLTMWQVVGRDFNPTKLMKSVLQLATGDEINVSEPELVRQNLEKALSGKRFLLVLDDVWSEDQIEWENLKGVLKYGARGSKIIVTTRSLMVSSMMGSSNPLVLQPLSDDQCSSLFQHFAFGDGEVCHSLVEIGDEIVKKCRGVPLAAIALGSLLRFKRNEIDWFSVLNSETWELAEGGGENKILAALRLSYYHLTPRSKQCFAFCSVFPKNYEIEKEKLIQLWVANGFISSQRSYDAETIGNDVFSELLLRSFFQQGEKDVVDGHKLEYCKMHDLMHDLARSVAGGECRILGYDEVEDIQNRTRHLSITQVSSSSLSQALFKPQSLRTVVSLGDGYLICKPQSLRRLLSLKNYVMDANVLRCVFSELKFLRVLDLSASGIKNVPATVGKLILLRYLDLSTTFIKKLPSSISLLQNLEYLNLSQTYLRKLPKKLRNMQSLRHLDISNCLFLTHMPPGLSQLTCLRRLSDFQVGKGIGCSIGELKDLNLHGELNIKFYGNVKNESCAGQKILKSKQHLQSLRLDWTNASSVDNVEYLLDDLCPHASLKRLRIFNYGGHKFPTWLAHSQIQNLVEVELIGCKSCEHIPQFGNLQFLAELRIEGMGGVKRIDAEFYGDGLVKGFPSLKEFTLDTMPNLEEWSGPSEAFQIFPCLHSLIIVVCPKLMAIPRFPRIQHLKTRSCNGSLLSFVGTLTSLSSLILKRIDGMISLPSGSLRNLASLTELTISDCTELQTLPVDEMHHLTALQHLEISYLDDLTSFPLNVDHLSALQSLHLSNCINLGSLPEGLHNLISLKSLKIRSCPTVTLQPEVIMRSSSQVREFEMVVCYKKLSLSQRLQYLQTLQALRVTNTHKHVAYPFPGYTPTLCICCCDDLGSLMEGSPAKSLVEVLGIEEFSSLTALPEWVAELRSLRRLRICDCPELASLPSGLQDLRALQRLHIYDCPQLERRCEKESGEDWKIISHVPYIDIRSLIFYPFGDTERTVGGSTRKLPCIPNLIPTWIRSRFYII